MNRCGYRHSGIRAIIDLVFGRCAGRWTSGGLAPKLELAGWSTGQVMPVVFLGKGPCGVLPPPGAGSNQRPPLDLDNNFLPHGAACLLPREQRASRLLVPPASPMSYAAACRTLVALVASRLLASLATAVHSAAVCRALCALAAPRLLATPSAAVRYAAVCRALCTLFAARLLAPLAAAMRFAAA